MKTVWRILIAGFLVAHGFVHLILRGANSWLTIKIGLDTATLQALGLPLIVITITGFCIGGLLLLFSVKWWRPITLISAALSLVLLSMFWNLSFWVAILINIAILGALLKISWFKTTDRKRRIGA